MNLPPARRPVRWEDLTDCLAWPLLLRLPGLAMRWSRLLVGYVAAIPLVYLMRNPPKLWLVPFEAMERQRQQAEVLGLPNAANQYLWDYLRHESLEHFSRNLDALSWSQWTYGILAVVGVLILLGFAATMIARSTALEVARGLEVSPRHMTRWTMRRWRSAVLWLWPIPFLAVLAIVPVVPLVISAQFLPFDLMAVLLKAIGAVLALVWLVLAIVSLGAAPLAPAAAACDDGDDFDIVQRTMAITLSKPVRLLLCYAWVALVAWLMMWIASLLVVGVRWLLAGGGQGIMTNLDPALVPLMVLVPAIGISVIASGLTLAYLYLRRIADEQDYSEVPVQG